MSNSSIETTKRLCRDCKHYYPGKFSLKAGGCIWPAACLHPGNLSLVDERPRHDPEYLRYCATDCGMHGQWWEPRSAVIDGRDRGNS